ncbi:MAG: ABC transporter permease [Gemmatimonadales bacterium]|jgi:predicted permease
MREFVRELGGAAGRLRRARGFSGPAIATLALGIGATVAVFSVVYSVLIDPLPYPDARRLVWLDHGALGLNVTRGLEMSDGIYLHYRRENRSLEELGLFMEVEANLTGNGPPERVQATLATPSLFRVLGTSVAAGRVFVDADAAGERTHVVILSHGLWTRRYGSDPGIVGRAITLDGTSVEVVGVMSPRFAFPSSDTQLWIPFAPDPNRFGGFSRRSVARLLPGVSVQEAEADLQRLIPGLVSAYPGRTAESAVNEARLRARVVPLKEQIVGDASRALWLVLGTAALVFLIACVNVANLLLVRAEERDPEVAVRMALGASTGAMARHYLAESFLLATAAGGIGVAVAGACVALIVELGPANLPRIEEVGLNGPSLAVALGLGLAVSLVCGAVPLRRRGPNLVGALREGGYGGMAGRRRIRVRRALVATQVALAVILLSGAGLMLRSFAALRSIDPGFRADHLLTFDVGLPENDYPTREAAVAFHAELLDRLESLPGVVSAGAATCLPLCGSWSGSIVAVEGRSPTAGELPPVVAVRRASADYLKTLKTSLLAGRMLERGDRERRTGAAVISESMAEAYWPGENALGRRFYYDLYAEEPDWYTVVGVVQDMPIQDLTESRAPRTVYLPLLHTDGPVGPSPRRLSYTIRADVPPLSLSRAARAAVWAIDDELPVANVRTMESILSQATARTAFTMVMLVIAALTALALGSVGVYGVVSYVVSRRKREIAVRKALGADSVRIGRTVLTQGIVMVGAGIVIGLMAALAVSRVLTALLYSVKPTDPVTYVAVSTMLLAVALLAAWLPAHRAAQVDPAMALREE